MANKYLKGYITHFELFEEIEDEFNKLISKANEQEKQLLHTDEHLFVADKQVLPTKILYTLSCPACGNTFEYSFNTSPKNSYDKIPSQCPGCKINVKGFMQLTRRGNIKHITTNFTLPSGGEVFVRYSLSYKVNFIESGYPAEFENIQRSIDYIIYENGDNRVCFRKMFGCRYMEYTYSKELLKELKNALLTEYKLSFV